MVLENNSTTNYIILNEKDLDETNNEEEVITDPIDLSKSLQKLMLKLKGENLIDDKSIDYGNFVKNNLFINDYSKLTNQLKKIDLNQLIESNDSQVNDSNVLSFFINIYNALTIHAISYLYQTDSKFSGSQEGDGENQDTSLLSQLNGKFWSRMAYIIGKEKFVFSLDDIEHGVLRANRVHPSTNKRSFDENDPRLKYCVKKFDPRIHFALNCGAKGCPAISFYSPSNLNTGLRAASINYVTGETNLNLETKTIELPRLFLWYKLDFIQENENEPIDSNLHDQILLKYVWDNLRENEEKKNLFYQLIQHHDTSKLKINYSTYDWQINTRK